MTSTDEREIVSLLHLREGVTDHGVLGAVLDHADRAPDRPAVKDLDRALPRGELRAAAGRVAAGLLQKGVQPGDRVALLIGNSVDFVVAALGCLWAGRSEEHTSELQSLTNIVCRLLLEKKKIRYRRPGGIYNYTNSLIELYKYKSITSYFFF